VGLYVSMDSLILIVIKQEYDNQKKLFRLGWGWIEPVTAPTSLD